MMEFLNSNSFVPICKENVLYFDYEFKNYHSFRDYTDQLILRILKRAESEVPEHGDFVPLFEFFANPDIKCDIVVFKKVSQMFHLNINNCRQLL